jgi:lipopolysaccharide/colanic/teichoic acid biosynthesis glycosyltransferase
MTGFLTRRRYDPIKRLLDITIAVAALPVVLPVLAACALAITVDSRGPIVFQQRRTGRDGRPFSIYKFRTMVKNADELKKSLQHLSVVPYPDFKLIDDPRITRVGGLLRKTSLDELPQIWNILRGDMSFVGPRPTSFAPETYDLWHARRLEVRPGLTGLWQITGRNTTDFDERSRLDDQYIRTRSLCLDLRILLRTIPEILRQRGH